MATIATHMSPENTHSHVRRANPSRLATGDLGNRGNGYYIGDIMDKRIILGGLAIVLFLAVTLGAWQLGAYQQQQCSASWYWTGYNVRNGLDMKD